MTEKDFEDLNEHLKMIINGLDPNSEEIFRLHRMNCRIYAAHLDKKMSPEVVKEYERCEQIDELNRIWRKSCANS